MRLAGFGSRRSSPRQRDSSSFKAKLDRYMKGDSAQEHTQNRAKEMVSAFKSKVDNYFKERAPDAEVEKVSGRGSRNLDRHQAQKLRARLARQQKMKEEADKKKRGAAVPVFSLNGTDEPLSTYYFDPPNENGFASNQIQYRINQSCNSTQMLIYALQSAISIHTSETRPRRHNSYIQNIRLTAGPHLTQNVA